MKLTTHLRLLPNSKNEWSYTFMTSCSVEAQGQLYLHNIHTNRFTSNCNKILCRIFSVTNLRVFGTLRIWRFRGESRTQVEYKRIIQRRKLDKFCAAYSTTDFSQRKGNYVWNEPHIYTVILRSSREVHEINM